MMIDVYQYYNLQSNYLTKIISFLYLPLIINLAKGHCVVIVAELCVKVSKNNKIKNSFFFNENENNLLRCTPDDEFGRTVMTVCNEF
jgi:hypothetical protein